MINATVEYKGRLYPLKNIDLKNNYHQQKWKFRTILTIKRVGIKFLFKACSKPLFEMKYLVLISSFYFLLRTNVRFFLKLLLSLLRVWHMCVSDIASMQEQWIQVKRNQFFSILFFWNLRWTPKWIVQNYLVRPFRKRWKLLRVSNRFLMGFSLYIM